MSPSMSPKPARAQASELSALVRAAAAARPAAGRSVSPPSRPVGRQS